MPHKSAERLKGGMTLVSPDVKIYYNHSPLVAAIEAHNRRRPSYFEADRRVGYMSNYIRLELEEVQEELEKYGTPNFSPKDTAAEFTDVFVVLTSLATCAGVSIDQNRIWPYVNGQGTHSNILEQMREISGHITQENVSGPTHQLYILLASAINHAPLDIDIAKTLLTKVLPKNRRNHYAKYYSGRDEMAGGTPLDRDEMIQQHDHVYQALRLFRKAFAGPEGLEPKEHLPYAMLFHDFRHSPFALSMIKQIIELEQKQRQSAIT